MGAAALLIRTRALIAAAPAGRMSLTGYLGESIVLAAIFCGWGLGLFGQLRIATAALITLGVWIALELVPHVWLRHFTYGPFEWALRCWSTHTWAPLRTKRSPITSPTSGPGPACLKHAAHARYSAEDPTTLIPGLPGRRSKDL